MKKSRGESDNMFEEFDKLIKKFDEATDEFVEKLKDKEKPVLTNAEKTILENIPKEFKYIARDEIGKLYIYEKKPSKDEKVWYWYGLVVDFGLFNHLFNFIKWEDSEPNKIEELLKND